MKYHLSFFTQRRKWCLQLCSSPSSCTLDLLRVFIWISCNINILLFSIHLKKTKIAKYTPAGMVLQSLQKSSRPHKKNKRSNNMQQIANFKALKMITKDLLLRFQGNDARKQTPATQAATALSSIFAPQIRWAAKNCRKSRHKQPLHWIDGMSSTKLLHKQRTLVYYLFIDFTFFMSLSMVITWLNLVLIDVAHW